MPEDPGTVTVTVDVEISDYSQHVISAHEAAGGGEFEEAKIHALLAIAGAIRDISEKLDPPEEGASPELIQAARAVVEGGYQVHKWDPLKGAITRLGQALEAEEDENA